MQGAKVKQVLFVILITLFIVATTYALFRGSANIEGSIKAATWSVSLNQEGVEDVLNVYTGTTNANYTLNIQNNSEVDITYNIVISNLPAGVEVDIDNSGTFLPQDNNHTITIPNAGTIPYSITPQQQSHILTFRAPTGTTPVQNQNVSIDVITRQVL